MLTPIVAAILMPISSISVVIFATISTNFLAKREVCYNSHCFANRYKSYCCSGFLVAFIRAVKNGQYKDTYTPPVRIILDDETEIKKRRINNLNHQGGSSMELEKFSYDNKIVKNFTIATLYFGELLECLLD